MGFSMKGRAFYLPFCWLEEAERFSPAQLRGLPQCVPRACVKVRFPPAGVQRLECTGCSRGLREFRVLVLQR